MVGDRMIKIAKFFALPAPDRALLFQSLTAIVAMRAGVWMLPFARARRLADAMSHPMRANSSCVRPSPEKIAWAVATASRAVPSGGNCLVRALATGIVLKRYRYPSELKIGVMKPVDGHFGAHAWLESGGIVVIGDFELDRYMPLGGPDSVGR
jgi:hypothetical protein